MLPVGEGAGAGCFVEDFHCRRLVRRLVVTVDDSKTQSVHDVRDVGALAPNERDILRNEQLELTIRYNNHKEEAT